MPVPRIFLGCSVFSFSRYKNSSSYKDEYRQGIKCSFCTVVKESSLNEGSIEQTNFLKLSASIAGTDGQHITETLSTVVTFQNKHLNVYIWMKETKLYVLRVSVMWQVLQQTLFYRPNDLQSDTENIWHGRNDRTFLVGKTNGKPSILWVSLG